MFVLHSYISSHKQLPTQLIGDLESQDEITKSFPSSRALSKMTCGTIETTSSTFLSIDPHKEAHLLLAGEEGDTEKAMSYT